MSTIGGFIHGEPLIVVPNICLFSTHLHQVVWCLKALKLHCRLTKIIALRSRGLLQHSYSTLQSPKIENFLNTKNVNYDRIKIDFIYGLASSETRIKMKQNQIEVRLTKPNLVFHIHYHHVFALDCQS